jgi:hypothetical protein
MSSLTNSRPGKLPSLASPTSSELLGVPRFSGRNYSLTWGGRRCDSDPGPLFRGRGSIFPLVSELAYRPRELADALHGCIWCLGDDFGRTCRPPGMECFGWMVVAQFQAAVTTVAKWRAADRCVFIHCAQGHGRTATITAAGLVELALAPDVDQALARIRAARRFASPSGHQKAALVRYLSNFRARSADHA